MLAQSWHRWPARRLARVIASMWAFIGLLAFSSACDKVPLTAPGGTVITLFATANSVPLNGEIEIIATAIENGTTQSTPTTPTNPAPGTPTSPTAPTSTSSTGAGTPVQNGTLITFTTTLGRIEPADARTTNGQVRVRFITGPQSGTATITAFSGGASGKLENLKVGTAAVERVLLTATPQTLGPLGGASEISARVEDTSGAPVPGVPVTFTADIGTLSAGSATTDANGVAKVTLSTTAKSTVTANVAGKTATVAVSLNPRTGLSLTPPQGTITALQPAVFSVNVATTAVIRNVTMSWGDGSTQSIGSISAQTSITHVYQEDGLYTVIATATDASGFVEQVQTSVLVLAAQPPSVTVTATPSSATLGQSVRLIAQVSGNTSAIVRYDWNFDVGAEPPSRTTTSNQVNVRWTSGGTGTRVISVTVTQASGPTGDGFGTVNIVTSTTSIVAKQ
jgi:adhesin/invasin